MRINWNIFKFIFLVGIIATLYSFSNNRNTVRKLTKIDIEFIDENSPFITLDAVNKLLIQKYDSLSSIDKETLVLNKMEARLLENPMIKNAEVYVTIVRLSLWLSDSDLDGVSVGGCVRDWIDCGWRWFCDSKSEEKGIFSEFRKTHQN